MLKRREVLRGIGGLVGLAQLPGCAGMQPQTSFSTPPEPGFSPQMEAYIHTFDSTFHWQKKNPEDKKPFIITYGWGKKFAEKYTTSNDMLSASCQQVLETFSATVQEDAPTADQKKGIAIAMREIERIANVIFVEYAPGVVTNVQTHHPNRPMITFVSGNFEVIHAGGTSSYPDKDGCVIGFSDTDVYGNMRDGSFSLRTIEHELGHAVGGLKHPSDDAPENHDVLSAALANQNFAIMSDFPSGPNSLGGAIASRTQDGMVPSTYMTLDIAALQKFLGTNWDCNPQNTPYTLNGKPKIWTVWNGRQQGVFDATAYTGSDPAYINLNSGPVGNPTHMGDEYVWIADRTVIAKAIGAMQSPNIFVGNTQGGSTFVGGQKANSYELAGKGNTAIARGEKNLFIVQPGTQVTIHGFNCACDTIEIANSRRATPSLAYSWGDPVLVLKTDAGRCEVALKGLQGKTKDIKILCNSNSGNIADAKKSSWAAIASHNKDPNNPQTCNAR